MLIAGVVREIRVYIRHDYDLHCERYQCIHIHMCNMMKG
jgi:hypothetical protein